MNAKVSLIPSKFVIARNVEALRDHHRWSQHELSRRSGVSQSTISNMENPEKATPRYSPTTDNVDAVAAVFGITGAILAMPLPIDLLLDFGKISIVLTDYAQSDPNGRRAIEAVSELARPRQLTASNNVL